MTDTLASEHEAVFLQPSRDDLILGKIADLHEYFEDTKPVRILAIIDVTLPDILDDDRFPKDQNGDKKDSIRTSIANLASKQLIAQSSDPAVEGWFVTETGRARIDAVKAIRALEEDSTQLET